MLINLRNALMASRRSPLPPGARWVEYLEASGSEDIETGIKPTANTQIDITFSLTQLRTQSIFGGREGALSTMSFELFNLSQTFRFDGTSQYSISTITVNTSSIYRFVYDGAGATLYNLTTGESEVHTPAPIIDGSYDIALFGLNTAGRVNNKLKGRIYSCKIWRGSILVRDFHPIAIGTTGYMLDMVSGQYLPYGNAGSGDFVVGPDAN